MTPKEAKFYSEHTWSAFVRIKDDADKITNYIDYVEFDKKIANDILSKPIVVEAVNRTKKAKFPGSQSNEI